MPPWVYGLLLLVSGALGIWVAGEAEQLLGRKDAAPIVIDEIVGILLTYYAVPVSLLPVGLGFLFFRLFDIAKPWPRLELLPGGWGIMLDDVLAGLLAQSCLRLFLVGWGD